MNINIDITIPETYSDAEAIESVAIYRGGWVEWDSRTKQEAFDEVILNEAKTIIKNCLITKQTEEARLSIESQFNETN